MRNSYDCIETLEIMANYGLHDHSSINDYNIINNYRRHRHLGENYLRTYLLIIRSMEESKLSDQ
jgi:hypothetical protein